MRQVLVDSTRAHGAAKRGGGEQRVWDTDIDVASDRGQPLKLLELRSALEALARKCVLAESSRCVLRRHDGRGWRQSPAAQLANAARPRFARAWLRQLAS